LAVADVSVTPARLTEQGIRYLHGSGVARDTDRAIVYLCAAAIRRQATAAFELGWLHYHGRGVPRDDGLAVAWMYEAERLGKPIPVGLKSRIAKVDPEPLRCTLSNGLEFSATDRRRTEFLVAIYEMAPKYDLDPALVREVVRAESNFNAVALSPKGAIGLMQLIPSTAKRFGVEDPFKPIDNLRGGMAYLQWLLRRFDGNLRLALAGYNAGEAAVERYGGVPPYPETRRYVRRILERYGTSDA
jgi:soluble lytic murein transglycosylase-like protein